MINASVVTEDRSDAQLLKRLLPPDLISQVEFIIGGGSDGAQSLAGSILASKRRPVALVVDADGRKDQALQEFDDLLSTLLRQVSGNVPFDVLIAKPEIEIVYFYDRVLLERLIGAKLDDVIWTTAQYEPRKVLQNRLGERYGQLVDMLDEAAIAVLRQHPLIVELSRFLTQAVVQPI